MYKEGDTHTRITECQGKLISTILKYEAKIKKYEALGVTREKFHSVWEMVKHYGSNTEFGL